MSQLSQREIENLLCAAIASVDNQRRKQIKERLCATVSTERRGAVEWLWNVWMEYGSPLDIREIAVCIAAVIAAEPEKYNV